MEFRNTREAEPMHMTNMPENVRRELCLTYIAATCFADTPDTDDLGMLFRDLDVSQESIEKFVGKLIADSQS